jgi:hypothetical protein
MIVAKETMEQDASIEADMSNEAHVSKGLRTLGQVRLYPPHHGVLEDLRDNPFPSTLSCWNHDTLSLPAGATHFGYVHDGETTLSQGGREMRLGPRMYFSVSGEALVRGSGLGITMSRWGYDGFFQIGGPSEKKGRLKYIDGCTDSLLLSPIMLGDPCLNLLHFPRHISQTSHTHPSMRVGIVVEGNGVCITPEGELPLYPGAIFIIADDALHAFRTTESEMTVIAYHPDSDFGPTHEHHPMISRTIVNGVSASQIAEIRTK